MRRVLRIKMFLASTLEEMQQDMDVWLEKNNICPGNYTASDLYKHGGVYQMVIWYATVVEASDAGV